MDFEEKECLNNKREMANGKTVHNMSSSSLLRKKSDHSLVTRVRCGVLKRILGNICEVVFGTKLFVLFPAAPLAFVARYSNYGRAWIFAFSLLGLAPLAERVSFLTEQIAFFTGPTVGGLLNATCGNATELIIALFALAGGKMDVVKYSLLGSILSNLLLVLGSSLFCGGIANLKKEQNFDRKQADANSLMLWLGLSCHILPLMFRYTHSPGTSIADSTLHMSRVSSIVMLIAYVAYLFFQLKTRQQLYDPEEVKSEQDEFVLLLNLGLVQEEDDDEVSEEAVIGFWSAFAWLAGMTTIIAFLSEFVVGTIEDASSSWGISVSFISIILLPIVGNAAEHAGAIIFAFKNKLDISLGVALGSATQISMFVVPLTVIVAWIVGIRMDLDMNILETGSLALAILVTSFSLQDGTSHYMKGLVMMLCYIVIGACFFFHKTQTPIQPVNVLSMGAEISSGRVSLV